MYSTDAIVLRGRPAGEADELVSCYTRDFGKLVIKARSSKKITTKQGIFLHNPSVIRCNFVLSRAGYIFSGIKSVRGYPSVLEDITALAYIRSFLDLCDKIMYEGQKDEELWDLLSRVLDEAEELAGKGENREGLWRAEKDWLMSLLKVLGVAPSELELDNIKNAQQLDKYIQTTIQNKLERPVDFFGLRSYKQNA